MSSAYAIFNEYGDCVSVIETHEAIENSKEVAAGTKPQDIWYDAATDTVREREPFEDKWGDVIELTVGFTVPAIPGCAVFANGEKLDPGSVFAPDGPSRVYLEMKGRYHHSAMVTFADYAEQRRRAYPSVVDQLDMIFASGILEGTPWHDAIEAVKGRYPKPSN